jgi:predicted CopG family antitoxin
MPRTKLPRGSVPVTFRLPREVQKLLLKKARREEVSFSEVVRRALRREIQADKAFAKQYGPNGSHPA